ncbi:helix-turn-helix domain-containing protein [Micromonospora sp. NPDC047738]|uniref:helix-turn-helix domain-containing protein n=1 Tax=Micromonospora sp. NPDC047738 TaxID=3155741 RepID=UPI0033C23695
MELLRLAKAAKRLGVHPVTLRLWADSGKIPVTWVGRERRFSSIDVEARGDRRGPAPGGACATGRLVCRPGGGHGGCADQRALEHRGCGGARLRRGRWWPEASIERVDGAAAPGLDRLHACGREGQ